MRCDDDTVFFVPDQYDEWDSYNSNSQFGGRHVVQLRHIILISSEQVFVLTS
jgi:hypothetical protein